MVKKTNGTNSPMNTGALKRVFSVLVVLLLASVLMVGAGSASVSTQAELNTAITDATNPTTIELADGTYNLLLKDGTTPNMVDKEITFRGSNGAIFDLIGIVGETWHTQDTGAKITFDGVTVKWNEDNEGYQGFANAEKVVYKDCIIYGTQFMGGDADFINCVFKAENTEEKGYAVYGRGAGDLTFTDCTFKTDGRAIMLYQDQTTEVNITLTRCIFTDNGAYTSKDKAVVETGDGEYKTSVFRIIFNDCTIVDGESKFEPNNSNSPLWGNKDNIPDDRLIVVFADMSGITLETDKEYDGQKLTYTGTAEFKRHNVTDYSVETLTTLSYQWYEMNNAVTYDVTSDDANAPKDAGEYQFKSTSKVSESGTEYTISVVKDVITISPATLTITIDEGQGKEVGGTEPALTYSSTGNLEGETPLLTQLLTRVSGEKAGTYLISFSDNTELADNSPFLAKNYILKLSEEPVYFTINPTSIIRGDGVQENYALTEEDVSQADKDTLNSTIEASYEGKFSAGKYFINVSVFDAQGQKVTSPIKFIVPYNTLGISGDAGKYEFVVLHLKDNGDIEPIEANPKSNGLEIGPTTTSPFAIGYSVKPIPPKDTSSHSQGSSVWLTETPTPTPTPTETEKPTDTVPTDIPVTQPTATPSTPGFGILAALAGLGAVAVLRRK